MIGDRRIVNNQRTGCRPRDRGRAAWLRPAAELGPAGTTTYGVIVPYDFAMDREIWRWVPPEVNVSLCRPAPRCHADVVDGGDGRADQHRGHRPGRHGEPARRRARGRGLPVRLRQLRAGRTRARRRMCEEMVAGGRGRRRHDVRRDAGGARATSAMHDDRRRVPVRGERRHRSWTSTWPRPVSRCAPAGGSAWATGSGGCPGRTVHELAVAADDEHAGAVFISCTNLADLQRDRAARGDAGQARDDRQPGVAVGGVAPGRADASPRPGSGCSPPDRAA